MAKRCPVCGKKVYTEVSAYHAALGTSRSIGRPVRVYACPEIPGAFHLTKRKEWRT